MYAQLFYKTEEDNILVLSERLQVTGYEYKRLYKNYAFLSDYFFEYYEVNQRTANLNSHTNPIDRNNPNL